MCEVECMALADYEVYPDVDNLMADIKKYDLFEHVVELEAYGMTVVPPEKMQASEGFIERLRDAIMKACEERNGIELGEHTNVEVNARCERTDHMLGSIGGCRGCSRHVSEGFPGSLVFPRNVGYL